MRPGIENAGATPSGDSPWDYRRFSVGDCLSVEVTKTPEMTAACAALAALEAETPECTEDETFLDPLYRAASGTTDWENLNPGQCIGPADLTAAATTAWTQLTVNPTPANVQPPNGWTIVHFDTIVHTTDQPQNLTTELLGIPVEIRATPAEYTWDFGDGETLTTTDPGKPHPDQTLVHQYTALETYEITLTTTWTGQFRIAGTSAWTNIDGTATTTDTTDPLDVVELRPRLVTDPLGQY